jgi:hypothetical protein
MDCSWMVNDGFGMSLTVPNHRTIIHPQSACHHITIALIIYLLRHQPGTQLPLA